MAKSQSPGSSTRKASLVHKELLDALALPPGAASIARRSTSEGNILVVRLTMPSLLLGDLRSTSFGGYPDTYNAVGSLKVGLAQRVGGQGTSRLCRFAGKLRCAILRRQVSPRQQRATGLKYLMAKGCGFISTFNLKGYAYPKRASGGHTLASTDARVNSSSSHILTG